MSSWQQGSGQIDIVPRNRIQTGRPGRLVSVHMGGGIGNRLFQIMAGLGYAERTGRQFVFYEEHMTHNPHTKPRATKELLLALFPRVKVHRERMRWNQYVEEKGAHYECNTIPDMSGSVVLHGYFQNIGYFPVGVRESWTVPRPKECHYDCSGLDFAHTYFIHFRLGDYVDSEFDMDKRPYYTEAVRRIRVADPAATFLVFSDQPSKLELGQYGLMTEDVRLVPASIGIWESLYLMSRCTGAICANSSFSWFGAFGIRGTGPIFMPAVWSRLHASCPNPPWAESC